MLKPCAPVDPPEISPRISFCSSDSVHKSPPARLNGYSFTPKTVSNKYVFLDARVITADIGDLDIALNESKAVINTLEKRIKVLRESEF